MTIEIKYLKNTTKISESADYKYRGFISEIPKNGIIEYKFIKNDLIVNLDILIVADKPHTTPKSLIIRFIADQRASGCKAKMNVRIITIKDNEISVLPELIVENNDVDIDHTVAIGPLDQESLFYIKSRGVSDLNKLF